MYDYIKNKNVLYIEDDVDVLSNISTLLENYFAKFYSVTNAEDG